MSKRKEPDFFNQPFRHYYRTGNIVRPAQTNNMAFSELIVLSLWYSDRHVSVKDLYIFHFNLKQLINPHEAGETDQTQDQKPKIV